MKRLVTIALAALALGASAETFNAKQATFVQLFRATQQPSDTPEHAAMRAAAEAEFFGRGPETLSNLMDRIHTENVMIGVFAMNMVRNRPVPQEQGVPVLLSFLTATNSITRKMSAFFLSFYRAPEHAGKVLPLLDDEKTRGAAIRALGKWQVTNSLPRIEPFLRDKKERVRVVAANALRDIADPRAVPMLVPALGDPMFTVRNTAARSILTFGATARDPLIAALDESSAGETQRQLIRCLGDLRDKHALPHLEQFLKSDDPDTRADSRRSMDQINGFRSDSWFATGGD